MEWMLKVSNQVALYKSQNKRSLCSKVPYYMSVVLILYKSSKFLLVSWDNLALTLVKSQVALSKIPDTGNPTKKVPESLKY